MQEAAKQHGSILVVALAGVLGVGSALALPWLAPQQGAKSVAPTVKCADAAGRDQDDMCIWVHPTEPALSTVIASDKEGSKVFVYDLDGKTLQTLAVRFPGNIDLRYGFPLGKDQVDIVAVNLREDRKIAVFKVDPRTRHLQRVDNDAIRTAENYGGTLFRSAKTGKFYFLATSKGGHMDQYELADDGAGKVAGKKVRSWQVGFSEAAVADDEAGKLYIGEEAKGVWEVGGEPEDTTPGKLVIKVGEHGLTGDVEGLAIYHLPEGKGYLIVSNQGSNNFKVYERKGAHAFVGTFAIKGAIDTDGLDVGNANLGPSFPSGLFACHTGVGNCPVLLTPWDAIAKVLPDGVKVDTSWDRRKFLRKGDAP